MHGRRLEHTAAFGEGGARGLRRVRCGGCAAAAAQRAGERRRECGRATASGGGTEAGAERRRREMGGVGRNREGRRNRRPAQDTYMTGGTRDFL